MTFHIGDRIELAGFGKVSVEDTPEDLQNKTDNDADIVLKNALVVDSTGVYPADVSISDGVIVSVGTSQNAMKTYDADGYVLTAGRIFTGKVSEAGNAEELLFSGYSTAIFELDCGRERVAEVLMEKNSLPVNLGFIPSADSCRCFVSDDFCPVLDRGSHTDFEGENSDIMRRIAEQTILPAFRCGISSHVGTVEVGKLADLFLWRPEEFFRKPAKIFKSGRLVFDSTLTDRRDIVYSLLSCSTEWGVRNPCAFFTSVGAAKGYLGRRMGCERNVIAVEG